MSIEHTSYFLDTLGFNAVASLSTTGSHKADLQPISTVNADQIAVDEKVIYINGNSYWLCGAVNPKTNKVLQFRLFPMTTKTDDSTGSRQTPSTVST